MMARRRGEFPEVPAPLAAPIMDNHTHLESIRSLIGEGVPDPGMNGHVAAAKTAGVEAMVQIGCDLDSARVSISIAHEYPTIVAGVAIHPNEAVMHAGVDEETPDGLKPHWLPRHDVDLDTAIAQIAEMAVDERVRTISETGLDYFRAGEQGRAVQRQAFRDHLALARELDLPVQIHDRDAHTDVLEVLAADQTPEIVVFHCFSGDAAMARICVERGYYLSFAGTVTFKNSEELRAAARVVPPGQILIETDAPYLTPHPYRGAINHPALAALTARRLAQVRGEDEAVFCRRVRETSRAIYGI